MYVFGINIPLPEFTALIVILLFAALIFVLFQIRHINRHMRILEQTTLEIRKYEEQEMEQVRRFETDMQKLEAEEAELFITKIVPTVTKMENYVASELLKSKDPEQIKQAIVKKGINAELATKVVNSMTYYLDFFNKLPNRHVENHVKKAEQMNVKDPIKRK